ncbi:MAG: hypothetical protein KF749_11615 [Bacteroidetes bacterium]|nr:hypothetical protein [Bacteroidota bacterium]MCW5894512.1 hypothetical protein [Bacteroidota bacterium]
MNSIAENYVKLVLAVGQHDADYVDAYHGPSGWMDEARATPKPLERIQVEAAGAVKEIHAMKQSLSNESEKLRFHYLAGQLESLLARVEILQGKKFSFDQESKALYDAVAPTYPETHFRTILQEMAAQLPGSGSVQQRYDAFKSQFIIPKEKLDSVFKAAIEECRKRTKQHIDLPEHESFVVEYVTDKAWSGYNWFKGNAYSLIQMNTDLPIYIDRAVDLAAHEGYPGHHVYNALLEQNLLKKNGWLEFSVYALFSPQSLIAEGTANFGIDVVFSPKERIEFEREVLFPLAGLDSSKAELYYNIHALFMKLAYAGNEAARGYLDEKMTKDEAIQWLMEYALFSHERAVQRIKFFDAYRSYVINYNLGQDMVKKYIESRGGTPENAGKRWEEFTRLISSPRLPSGLVVPS